jgi:hypothetical protein
MKKYYRLLTGLTLTIVLFSLWKKKATVWQLLAVKGAHGKT